MNFYNAGAVNVLRTSQKDEQFTDVYAKSLSEIIRLCGHKFRNKFAKYSNPAARLLYYYLTSVSKYQTLGEEYTGVLRFVRSQNNIPNSWINTFWLILYIGGDDIFDRTLKHYERKIKTNRTLTPTARAVFLQCVQFFINNKDLLIRLNQTAFYKDGKYYNISNRLTEIQYIFLRNWMGDDSSSKTLSMLGWVSLFYLICAIFHKLYESRYQSSAEKADIPLDSEYTADECYICAEIKSNPSCLPCGHIFCWKCIFTCINRTAKCPICREPVQTSRVILLQNY